MNKKKMFSIVCFSSFALLSINGCSACEEKSQEEVRALNSAMDEGNCTPPPLEVMEATDAMDEIIRQGLARTQAELCQEPENIDGVAAEADRIIAGQRQRVADEQAAAEVRGVEWETAARLEAEANCRLAYELVGNLANFSGDPQTPAGFLANSIEARAVLLSFAAGDIIPDDED